MERRITLDFTVAYGCFSAWRGRTPIARDRKNLNRVTMVEVCDGIMMRCRRADVSHASAGCWIAGDYRRRGPGVVGVRAQVTGLAPDGVDGFRMALQDSSDGCIVRPIWVSLVGVCG
jgi:hypothetical protein